MSQTVLVKDGCVSCLYFSYVLDARRNVTSKCYLSTRAERLESSGSVQKQEMPVSILKTWFPHWKGRVKDWSVMTISKGCSWPPASHYSQEVWVSSSGLLVRATVFPVPLIFIPVFSDGWLVGEPPLWRQAQWGPEAALSPSSNECYGARNRPSNNAHHLLWVG